MKAVIHTKYGPPEVLQMQEVEKPVPASGEVLVKIHATTVNRTDCGFRQPEYLFVRLFSGIFKPKINILGTEFAGTVEGIGNNVTFFKVGDAVFGLNTFKFGTHAEYVCIPENKSIALKPENMTFEEAAAVCDGLMLAINYIRKIDFKSNPKILINGASGSIGSAAVQLAKYYGAEITAVCKAEHFDLIRSLGATTLIDYSTEDFTKTELKYDTVLDAVGKSSFGKCKQILNPGGVYYSTELGDWAQNVFLSPYTAIFSNKKVKFPIPTDNKEDVLFFKQLIERGNYKAIIDRKYPLEKIVEATKYVESGEKVGNVVITIF